MHILDIIIGLLVKIVLFSIPSILLRYLIFNRPLTKKSASYGALAITFLIGCIFPYIIEIFLALFISLFVLHRGAKDDKKEDQNKKPYWSDYYTGDKDGSL